MIARGIRNHNPGNVRASSIDWEGEVKPGNETSFTVFKAPYWGVRCMAKIIHSYYYRRGLGTVAGIINRYAPGHENPTNAYIDFVCKALNVSRETRLILNYETMAVMIRAMIIMECGSCPYTWEITTGVILAGLEPRAEIVSNDEIKYGRLY